MQIIAFILMIIGFISYYYAIKNESSNFNLATFSLWTLVGFIIMISKFFSTTHDIEKMQGILFFIGPLLVTILIYYRGSRFSQIVFFEKICIIVAFLLLLIYFSIEISPYKNVAVIEYVLTTILIVLDLTVAYPLIMDIKHNPISEKISPWFFWTTGNLTALIAIPEHTYVGSGFILYVMILCLSITVFITIKQKRFQI
jgi:hypothetical protein